MLCVHCKKEIEDASRFCIHCGQPITEQTAPIAACEQAPEKEQPAPRRSQKTSVGKRLLLVLLSFLLFITLFCSVLIVNVRSLESDEQAEKLFYNIDAAAILDQELFDWEKQELDRFYNWLQVNFGFQINDNGINELINDAVIREFIADKVAEGVESFFGDSKRLILSEEELAELFSDNYQVLERAFLCNLSRHDAMQIAFEMMDEDVVNLVDITRLKLEYKSVTSWINIAFSYVTLAVLLVLAAVIVFFMIRNHRRQALMGVGAAVFACGLLPCIAAVLTITPLWKMMFASSVLVRSLLGNLIVANLLWYGIAMGVGLACMAISVIVRRFWPLTGKEDVK